MVQNITIVDVAPRDGLQNEPEVLSATVRAELVQRLAAAGVPRIEVGSFVNPKQVPQMAGTDEVCAALVAAGFDLGQQQRFTALVPNMRGYERAVEAGLRHVRLVLAASESLQQANFKRPIAESVADFATIAARAQHDSVGFGIAIGAAFGCPFEGHVPEERVLGLAQQLIGLGADEVLLADTTGMGVPTLVAQRCQAVLDLLDNGPTLTAHFHNTRNTGYANAYAAWQAGVTSFDAALGGIGGCPFAPRAVGNIASEDLVHLFNGIGVPTGIDLEPLIAHSDWLAEQLGKALPALVGKAGPVYSHIPHA